ncbi:penicillin acylase family protein [Actinotalea subterranea]|uniref:penicillin acylase family protein n=1 Tax=Actinotalea subterranea TaxID=2607497 RepID=UPI0011EE077D|nr:penicillin acylase family protein [Actinotalea subterranea]
MPRRRSLRLLVGTAATLVLALVAVLALGATVVRRPLPDDSGTLTLPGLSGEVTVLRDARGVPSIYADDAEDLFRAQGFVHAQDRFFEMDYRRHVTAGRLSELVGENPEALDADKVIRTFGWRHVAEQEWDLLTDDTRRYLEAYADGVNSYLDQREPDSLALEYAVLGLQVDVEQPEPWDPVDSLAWLKAMAWDLRGNYDDELARALTYSTVRDVARVNELFPRYPQEVNAPILSEVTPASAPVEPDPAADVDGILDADLQRALDSVREALDAVPHLLGEGDGTGSNSWVVSGEHTASGEPLLANDPHLSISAPGIWSQMGLYCTEVDSDCPFAVSGFTFSGFPGVVIGHNAELAWGLTNLGADVTDFFLERTDRDASTYLRDGEQVPLEVRTETIEVNGGEPVELQIRSTVHGPIVSGALDVGRLASAPMPDGGRGSPEVSLAWTALEPGRTADAVFAFATASDAQDIADAAALFAVPSQNIVFATTDGHIGYQAPGLIPVRERVADGPVPSDGTWPRPGWDPRYDWQGYVDAADMPAALDPAVGYVVAANQAVTTSGAGPFLTADWDYGYRSERIRDLLDEAIAAGTPIDAELTSQMQNDAWSAYAAALVPALLQAPVEDEAAVDRAFTREGVDLLRDWDLSQDEDSAAAAYFAAVWSTLLELTFWDDLPEEEWPSGDSRWLEVVVRLLEQPDSAWWDDRRTVNVVESRDEILSRTLTTARLRLTVDLSKDAGDWEWGRLHTAAPEHAVLGGEGVPGAVRQLVNPRPLPVSGGSSIVNATAWDASTGSFEVTSAPSMRMVVDLADLDASTWVTLTGTSGHPGSVHYTDQFAAWARGETFPWPFSAEAVREASSRELTLRPETS